MVLDSALYAVAGMFGFMAVAIWKSDNDAKTRVAAEII